MFDSHSPKVAAFSRLVLTLDRQCDAETSRNKSPVRLSTVENFATAYTYAGREDREDQPSPLVSMELLFSKRDDASVHVRLRTREDRAANTYY